MPTENQRKHYAYDESHFFPIELFSLLNIVI